MQPSSCSPASQSNPRELPVLKVVIDTDLRRVNLSTALAGESTVTAAHLADTLRGMAEGSDDFEVRAEGAAQIAEGEWTLTPSEPILMIAKDRSRGKVGVVPWFMEFNDVFGQ